jgi:hypothetical protein
MVVSARTKSEFLVSGGNGNGANGRPFVINQLMCCQIIFSPNVCSAMSRDAKVVNEWDFDRIIPCHGDVIETGGKKAWQQVLGKFL